MSAVVIDGGIVHYESLGRGKPLLFLHGWLGSWRYWMATMSELSDTYRTYALDLWGFGDTDKSQPRYNVDQYVNLILAFMEDLGVQRLPVIGHSLGAVVALQLALSQPKRVDRLAVVSLPLTDADVSLKVLSSGKAALGGGLFGPPAEYGPVASEIDKADKQVIPLSVGALAGQNLEQQVCALRVPTLVVHGGKDPLVNPVRPDLGERELTDGLAPVRTVIMSQARHFPMLEEANQFNRLLRDFLTLDLSEPKNLETLELKEEWRRRMH